jgi:sugar phosphate isomerase/epimerase
MTIELALTPDGRWQIDGRGLVAAAHEAGFCAVGLPKDLATPEAASAYATTGLRCHELLALVLSDDGSETLSSAAGLAEAAAVVGAEWVLTVFRTGLNSQTADLIRQCAAIFASTGTRMAVEFSPMGPVSSIRTGLEIVAVAGAERAGLLIDSWHFCLGDSTWEDLAEVPLEQIAYVQFDDALAPVSDNRMRETMNRRAMPGGGILELDRFATTLLDRGWDGLVSVEVLSSELRELPVPDFARLAHAAAARYWT